MSFQTYSEAHYPSSGIFDYHPAMISAYRKWLVKKGLMTEEDESIAEHQATDGCMVTETIDPDKQYRFAVGAVPSGITDTDRESEKCSWFEGVLVKVTVDGTTMDAVWMPNESIAQYVYCLYDLTNDQQLAFYEDASDCRISLMLEPGKRYNLKVGAVPEYVTDVNNESGLCSWCEVVFETAPGEEEGEEEEELDDEEEEPNEDEEKGDEEENENHGTQDNNPPRLLEPNVSIEINGTDVTASWDKVVGAERYVYTLRDLSNGKVIASNQETDGRHLSLMLEPGKRYNLKVGAVPKGITDVNNESGLCSWCEVVFETAPDKKNDEDTPQNPDNTHSKLPDPTVHVEIDGTKVTATWSEIDGADHYIPAAFMFITPKRICNGQSHLYPLPILSVW